MTFSTHLNSGNSDPGTAYAHVLIGSAALLGGAAAADVLAVDSPTVRTGLGAGSTASATGVVTLTTDVVEHATADGTSFGVGLGVGAGLTLVYAIAGGCAPHEQILGVDVPFRVGCSTAPARLDHDPDGQPHLGREPELHDDGRRDARPPRAARSPARSSAASSARRPTRRRPSRCGRRWAT